MTADPSLAPGEPSALSAVLPELEQLLCVVLTDVPVQVLVCFPWAGKAQAAVVRQIPELIWIKPNSLIPLHQSQAVLGGQPHHQTLLKASDQVMVSIIFDGAVVSAAQCLSLLELSMTSFGHVLANICPVLDNVALSQLLPKSTAPS